MNNPCVILLSGGMDSATCLWQVHATWQGPIYTVAIDYGQRHRVELEFARELATQAGVKRHAELRLDVLSTVGGSPLTDPTIDVPQAAEQRQNNTVVPFRNLLFVTACAAYADGHDIRDLAIAAVRDDHAAYRDCRREFYDSVEKTLGLGAAAQVNYRIHTPLINHWKTDVVAIGLQLQVPYENTHTCYTGRRPACGLCDACSERIAAFQANGVADPLAYEISVDWTGAGTDRP